MKDSGTVISGPCLERFFAVTASGSVYGAHIAGEEGVPFLVKIQGRGQGAVCVGEKMDNGTMLSVAASLYLFIPEGGGGGTIQRELIHVNTHYWGGHTGPIVALFLDRHEALECAAQPNLVACDSRWQDDIVVVLKAIGEKHPTCAISAVNERFWLLPPESWKT